MKNTVAMLIAPGMNHGINIQPSPYWASIPVSPNGLLSNSSYFQPKEVKIEDNQKCIKFLPLQDSLIQKQDPLSVNVYPLYHKRGRYRRRRDKRTKIRVKYFDPCSAPLITSPSYFLIQASGVQSSTQYSEKESMKNSNELRSRQVDNSPFIVFKHRREAKKYKRYLGVQQEKLSDQEQSMPSSVSSKPSQKKKALRKLVLN